MTRQTITMREWVNASIEQRGQWLQDNVSLDETSHRILCWALMIQDAGGRVGEDVMLRVYERQMDEYA